MTIPIEKTYALENTLNFLRSLLDSKSTPRVPMKIRLMARDCLKHFPYDIEIQCLHAICGCGVFKEQVTKNKKIVTKKKVKQ